MYVLNEYHIFYLNQMGRHDVVFMGAVNICGLERNLYHLIGVESFSFQANLGLASGDMLMGTLWEPIASGDFVDIVQ